MNNRDTSVRSDDRTTERRLQRGITRRDAVGKLTSLSACAGALALAPQLAGGNTPRTNADAPGVEEFKRLVGTGFTVSGPVFGDVTQVSSRIALENVTEVSWVCRYGPPPVSGQRGCPLSLVFSSQVALPDATYAVDCEKAEAMKMFLHRIGDSTPDPPFIYEAILN